MNARALARFHRVLRIVAITVVLVGTVVVIWIDLTTGIWQEAVVLSGIAAGLLTFILTSFVLERLIARSAHRAWYPVTRLALTDILHALADDEASELSRGLVVPRLLTVPEEPTSDAAERLLREVYDERDRLTRAFARWTQFLASSADVHEIMVHVAELAERLDLLRDGTVEAERAGATAATQNALRTHVMAYNASIAAAIAEIKRVLADMPSDIDAVPAR